MAESAGVPGLEPRLSEPESLVLPITPYPMALVALKVLKLCLQRKKTLPDAGSPDKSYGRGTAHLPRPYVHNMQDNPVRLVGRIHVHDGHDAPVAITVEIIQRLLNQPQVRPHQFVRHANCQ